MRLEIEEQGKVGKQVGPGEGFAAQGLEDDEDGFGAGSAAGQSAEDGLPPVSGG